METKQIIVIRKDLNMRKGKMCAQAAHASLGAILKDLEPFYDSRVITVSCNIYDDNPTFHWLKNSFTKVVVSCDSEEELLKLQKKADEENILNCLIQDNGKTEFNGVKTYTCLAIGPGEIEKIDKVTNHLKLL